MRFAQFGKARLSWYFKLGTYALKLYTRSTKIDMRGWGPDINRLLTDYTRCQLSVRSDKLIAFEGLAQILAKRTGQRFVARVWTGKLAKSLFWCSADGLMTTPTPPQAPSWSWASKDGTIRGYVDCDSDASKHSRGELYEYGAGSGSLWSTVFLQENAGMKRDRGVVSLRTNALCLSCVRLLARCISYLSTFRQLKDDVCL